jgi:ferredoxin-NADP reductase/anaerobic selenocysteine-containing dehydrogenase
MRQPVALPTLDHAGLLEDAAGLPRYLWPDGHDETAPPDSTAYSCCFCGVGDSGVARAGEETVAEAAGRRGPGRGVLKVAVRGQALTLPASVDEAGRLEVATEVPLVPPGGVVTGTLEIDGESRPVSARAIGGGPAGGDAPTSQAFACYTRATTTAETVVKPLVPTGGCVKFRLSLMRQRPVFPIHVAPSVLDGETGGRRVVTYAEAISRLADLLLAHRAPVGRTLVYACGQIDYFTIFAMQEVFRLLGVRNLTGNAEHCLNAGAVHNEILTGQEGPFLTAEQGLRGPNRFYLLNGWNGFITHPPVFGAIVRREGLDAYLVDVMVTESAKALAARLGPDRVLLVRPRSDPHLALAVAHEVLGTYPDAIDTRFLQRFADGATFEKYAALARSETFSVERVAARIAPEPSYVERLARGIRDIAARLVRPEVVPVNIPSVGLSQTSGVVAHCLWGGLLAMLGKYGLGPDGSPRGGTLRFPGQINAESEVQGLSRKYFMGRIPVEDGAEAARRMGLPDDAYQPVLADTPRAALDYSDETPGVRELFLCFGTQFAGNMMGRSRWLRKLEDPATTIVVVDPIPEPYAVERAALIVPSPPHVAATKLYQNGEWRLALSVPPKRAPAETRSDPTIIYDVMAEIARRVESDPAVAAACPDLARHARSGYLRARFVDPGDHDPANGLVRIDGEVSRPQLYRRVIEYMSGGRGPLYCRPEHPDGRPIEWRELLEQGSLPYGGIGTTRYRLDYDDPAAAPFRDIYRRPRPFTFFMPTEDDLSVPDGIILNSGRSPLSDDPGAVRFAMSTFNSGKATPAVDMPAENPLHVSPALAERLGLRSGDAARVTNRETGEALVLPVVVTERVKGDTVYVSFHKCRAEIEEGRHLNTITSHRERCPYTAQTRVKATPVAIERVARRVSVEPLDTTVIDPTRDIPHWQGQATPLYVTDIVRETHDAYTFRFQGRPLCRFVYWPGQFCTLVLNIDGRKVVRSYTISSTPSRPFILEITVKRVPGGLVSNWLPDHLKVGDPVEISGPRGKFCLTPGKIPPRMLLIAAGSGITPIMSMARWLCDVSANVDVRCFNSIRTPQDFIFGREIELLTSRYRIFTPLVATTTRAAGDGWSGPTGRVTRQMLETLAPDLHERHVYMCGPAGFMDAVTAVLRDMQFDLANLHTESFAGVRTSRADKSAPAARIHAAGGAMILADQADEPAAGPITVEFARAGKKAMTDGARPLLDVAEAHDLDVAYGCRAGSCGDCKVRVLAGRVEMDVDDGLGPDEKAAGYVLTCVARPVTDCVLDA